MLDNLPYIYTHVGSKMSGGRSTPTQEPHKNRSLRRRGSVGKRGKALQFRKEKRDAQLYKGQNVAASVNKLTEALGLPLAQVKNIPRAKRLRLSAFIEAEKSDYVGTRARSARILDDQIKKGDFEGAKDTLNIPLDALREASVMYAHIIAQPRIGVHLDTLLRSEGEDVSPETFAARKAQVAASLTRIDAMIEETPDCSHQAHFEARRAKQNRQVLRQELMALDETAVQPNIEKQSEIREALNEEANRVVLNEMPQQFANLTEMMSQMGDGMSRLEHDHEVQHDMMVDMRKKQADFHQKQMQSLGNALSYLKQIDYATDVRYTRELALRNAGGIGWVAQDLFSIVTSVLFDDNWELSLSATRPLKQVMTTVITIFEVAAKWIGKLFDEIYSVWTCFEASTLSCLAAKAIKFVAIAVVLLSLYYLVKEYALGEVLVNAILNIAGYIKSAGMAIYECGKWLLGTGIGKAISALGTWFNEMGAYISENFAGSFPKTADCLQAISNGLSSIVATLKSAWETISSIGAIGGGAASTAKGWWDALTGSEHPAFKQFVVADNLNFKKFVLQTIPEEDDEELSDM